MNRILILIAFLATPQLHAAPYETAQRFAAGDVISAEVINDILDRIELSLKNIERSEMIGTWDINAYNCARGLHNPNVDVEASKGCLYDSTFDWDAVTTEELGYAKRVDTWTITAVSGSDSKFYVASTNHNMIYINGLDKNRQDLNDGNTHICAFVSGQAMLACALEFPDIYSGSSEGNFQVTGYFNVQRLSNTRVKLFWGPVSGGGVFNVLIMDKTDIPPTAPTALSASVAGNASAATVSLSWTINGSTATGGVVKRKLSFDGTWSTLGTPSTGSYSDTDITLNNSYWYRVFATNANGTSVGSNVVKINWYNTLPTINIPSVISIDENASDATSNFKTLSVSDADGHSLTLTLGSQSPGNDASDFTLASNGDLSFNATPNYENPADYDTNNIYDLTLTATDGVETVSQDFSVVVLNVSD
jgi:hypothetical protein